MLRTGAIFTADGQAVSIKMASARVSERARSKDLFSYRIYRLLRALLIPCIYVLYPWQVKGRHHVPPGPVILCPNHISWIDPPLMGLLLTRPVRYITKAEAFRGRFPHFILTRVGAYPVQRGHFDREAVRRSLTCLRQGFVLAVFPEGHRSKDGRLLPLRDGAALMALRTGAAVVPVGIRGPYRVWHRLRVSFGPPLYFKGPPSAENVAACTSQIRAAILRELGRDEAGVDTQKR